MICFTKLSKKTARILFLFSFFVLLSTSARAQQSPPAAVALYADAANIQNKGEFSLAIEEWQRFLKKYPADPLAAKAQNYLAVCQLQEKKYEDAVRNFSELLKKYPKFEQREDTLLNLGSAQFAWAKSGTKKEFTAAASTFGQLAKEFPQGKYTDQALYFQGESYYQSGNKAQSVLSYQALVEKHPKSPLRANAAYAWGVTNEELGKHAEAGKVYDQFLTSYPTHDLTNEVKMRKAETLLQNSEFAKAEQLLTQVTSQPGFSLIDHALYRQAFTLLKQDKIEAAAGVYAKLASSYQKSNYAKESTMLAGRCYYRVNKLTDAEKWLTAATQQGGDTAIEAGHWLCRIHTKNQKYSEAERLAASLIPKAQKSPYLVELQLDYADAIYEQVARRSDSIPLYEKIVADNPSHALASQALYNAGFAALEVRDYPKATQLSQSFLSKFPKHELVLDAQYVAAEAYLQQGKQAEAEVVFQTLAAQGKQRPELGNWQVRLALSMFLQKKYSGVTTLLPSLVGSLKESELKAQAQFLLGASYYYQNDFANAEKNLNASLATKANWRQADESLLVLSRTLRKLDRTDEAIAKVDSMIKQFPKSEMLDRAYYRLGEYHYAQSDFPKSIANYQKLLSGYTSSSLVPHGFYGLAWAQLHQKNAKASVDQFTQLITKYSKHELVPQAYHGRAIARQQAGDFDGGVSDIDQYLKLAPNANDRSDALYVKGLCLVGAERNQEATLLFALLTKEHPNSTNGDKIAYELAWSLKTTGNESEALKEFEKLVSSYPQSPLASEAYYHLGEAAYAANDYKKSEQYYTNAMANVTDAEVGEKAAHKLAWAQFQQEQYAKAVASYRKQGAAYPKGKLFTDARFMAGECLYETEEFGNALAAYQGIDLPQLSSDEMRALLLLHTGQSAGQLKQWAQGRKSLILLKTTFPESPLNAEADYELGWASYNEKNSADALKSFASAADSSRGKTGARARFMMGEIYFEQKKYEDASKEFKRVVYGFGGDDSVDEVKPWQAKCAYELGRCNEVQIRNAQGAERAKFLADANKYYSVVTQQFPTAAEAKIATTRLAALAKL
ncbi:MAG: hypothetical protein COA78_20670 [Blastopirellula sp.]|nr:MAG: hypothetical protein COA78_20670 [Blastopirellula sp.]